MKRKEIEQLLVDYVNNEISPENRKQLEELFLSDPELKKEAIEMAAIYQSLDEVEEQTKMSAIMDSNFYAMLQTAKADTNHTPNKVIKLNVTWLKTTAAIAACILAFIVGRYTVVPVQVIKYKTLIVKQPLPYQPKTKQSGATVLPVITAPTVKALNRKNNTETNPALAQQLRSVYASERIDAVTKLMSKPKLSPADLKILQLALQEDPNPNVRLTILNTLRPLTKQTEVQQVLIGSLNQQDNVLVQSFIVDMLVDVKSKQAIPQMIVLLDDKRTDVMVQNKIKGGIESFMN